MKKSVCVTLALLVMICCLSACNITSNMSGVEGKAEATPKVTEMMAALASDNLSDAKALLHPQAAETSDSAIAQMSAYLAGRNASAIQMKSINVSNTSSTAGTSRQERLAYQVTLTDDTVIYLNVVYLSNKQGTGFISFQLVLGVI